MAEQASDTLRSVNAELDRIRRGEGSARVVTNSDGQMHTSVRIESGLSAEFSKARYARRARYAAKASRKTP